MNLPALPLAGLRILDLSRLLPGPVASLHLADLGADVIKIEDPEVGDYARRLGSATADGEDSAYFRMINRNKRGLRLDLKQPPGRDVFLRLVADAEVVIESFRPGVAERLGVGYTALQEINPRLVYCSITGYGQHGPRHDKAGHDLNYLAIAGVLDQIGCAGGKPAIPNFQIADLLGGALTAAFGILAGVLAARATGQGRHIDVAMTDSVLAHSYFAALTLAEKGASAPRGSDVLSGGLPCYGVYACADGGYLAVGALEEKFWQRFCLLLGRPDFIPRQADPQLTDELAALLLSEPRAVWASRFADSDCCVTPVLTPEEALREAEQGERGMVFTANGLRQFAPPLRFSGLTFPPPRAAPPLAAHNREILTEAGFSPAQIDALAADGII